MTKASSIYCYPDVSDQQSCQSCGPSSPRPFLDSLGPVAVPSALSIAAKSPEKAPKKPRKAFSSDKVTVSEMHLGVLWVEAISS